MERVWSDIPFRGTPWASQMLKQLKYVGALGILTLAFQGPQPVEQKQTLWGFLLESSQLNHLLEHVIRVPSVESVGVIRVSSMQSLESLTGYGKGLLVTVAFHFLLNFSSPFFDHKPYVLPQNLPGRRLLRRITIVHQFICFRMSFRTVSFDWSTTASGSFRRPTLSFQLVKGPCRCVCRF